MEYRPYLELGCVEMGTATFRVMVNKPNGTWAALSDLTADPAILAGGHELGDYLRRIERNPKRAAGLAKARMRLAQSMATQAMTEQPASLAALRLQAGLSQTQLAEKMGTKQPAIARFEKDPSAMQYPTMSAIAKVFGCQVGDVANIIAAQTEASARHANQTH